MATVFVVKLPIIRHKIRSQGSFVLKSIFAIFIIAIVIGLYPSLLDVAHDFIFKRESSGLDEAMSSRSGGLSSQWENFLASPIIGNGFGVYAGSVPAKSIQYFMGVPISAAVEKGFLPTALLEEVGILGVMPFLLMMYSIIRLVLKNTAPSWLCMFFASIFINIGEYVFFATNAMGMIYWIIMMLCTVTHKSEIRVK
jgi:O-antigen ligase